LLSLLLEEGANAEDQCIIFTQAREESVEHLPTQHTETKRPVGGNSPSASRRTYLVFLQLGLGQHFAALLPRREGFLETPLQAINTCFALVHV